MRGYSIIALDNPKKSPNVGGVLRAANIFGVSFVLIKGSRTECIEYSSDTMNTWKHLPVIRTDNDIFDFLPYECTPIAVEITEDAKSLINFVHPESAMYIFGRENSSVSAEIIDKCKYTVKIPVKYCLNLAACVNVLLYDRMAKNVET